MMLAFISANLLELIDDFNLGAGSEAALGVR